jgi:hypothetical protein
MLTPTDTDADAGDGARSEKKRPKPIAATRALRISTPFDCRRLRGATGVPSGKPSDFSEMARKTPDDREGSADVKRTRLP